MRHPGGACGGDDSAAPSAMHWEHRTRATRKEENCMTRMMARGGGGGGGGGADEDEMIAAKNKLPSAHKNNELS